MRARGAHDWDKRVERRCGMRSKDPGGRKKEIG